MSTTPSAIPRRTIAKGAAWTIPAVSLAAAAPSLAASGNSTCPAGPGWRDVGEFQPNWSLVSGPGGGALALLNIGRLTPNLNAPVDADTFQWTPTRVTATDNTGLSHEGQISFSSPADGIAIEDGAELSAMVQFQAFDPPFDANHHLAAYTFTYTITWFRPDGTSSNCVYTSQVTATPGDDPDLPYYSGELTPFR